MAAPVLTPNAWLRWDLIRRHLASLPDPARILEVGMGQGAVGARLATYGAYTGVEPDERSRSVARSRLPATARVLAGVADLAADERFDLVCSFEVLEHIADDAGALRTWVEHLVPGGALIISVPAHQRRFAAADRLVGHLRRYSRDQLRSLVEQAGAEPRSIEATGFPFGYLLETGRNLIAARREQQVTSVEDRTAASGRLLQPPPWLGIGTQAATWPFRMAQRPFRGTNLATGWLLVARKPVA